MAGCGMSGVKMFVPYTIVNPLTTIRVARRLSRPGEVLVRNGDAVEPMHIVAQAVEPADFRIIDVARELDIPIKKTQQYLKVTRGDSIAEGDILATRGGIGGRVCRAPISGAIIGSGRGRLLLEADPQPIQINALVPGMIVETWLAEGVLIESVGAMIQATWGNGKEAYGTLRLVVRSPRIPLQAKHINPAAQGKILIGGSSVDAATLEYAAELQVRGIIVGSIQPSLIPLTQSLELAVIATEGMGDTPMCNAIFEMLQSLDGRNAAVSGKMVQRWKMQRPFIVVPMPTQAGRSINAEAPIEVGNRIRVLRGQYAGMSGTVSDLSPNVFQLATGARVRGVKANLGGNESVLIPYANLERLL
jgi:hypothetical protein